jgi:hypothetical protein
MLDDHSESLAPNLTSKDPKVLKGLWGCEGTEIDVREWSRAYQDNSRIIAVETNSVCRIGIVQFSLK